MRFRNTTRHLIFGGNLLVGKLLRTIKKELQYHLCFFIDPDGWFLCNEARSKVRKLRAQTTVLRSERDALRLKLLKLGLVSSSRGNLFQEVGNPAHDVELSFRRTSEFRNRQAEKPAEKKGSNE